MPDPRETKQAWTFLTNHAHVIMCLVRNPAERMRDIAAAVGITERAVQRIIAELEETGYVDHVRQGRRNVYRVHGRLSLRHSVERHKKLDDLIRLILPSKEGKH